MKTEKKYAICIDNKGFSASLEQGKLYEVWDEPEAEKSGMIRVIDESGEDYLYSESRFKRCY